jgi:uncharacterized protein (DUF1499 family)
MRLLVLLSLGALIIGAPLVILLVLVDDWSRDLTTNVAQTSPHAADPLLRPLELRQTVAEVEALVAAATRHLPHWEYRGRMERDGAVEIHLVRTTRLFRFKDDVTVRVRDLGEVREVSAVSASRLGRGDLGQNPRNLKELLSALRASM